MGIDLEAENAPNELSRTVNVAVLLYLANINLRKMKEYMPSFQLPKSTDYILRLSYLIYYRTKIDTALPTQ